VSYRSGIGCSRRVNGLPNGDRIVHSEGQRCLAYNSCLADLALAEATEEAEDLLLEAETEATEEADEALTDATEEADEALADALAETSLAALEAAAGAF